jgi:hypothetical protein
VVFGLSKSHKPRRVPLPARVADAIQAHMGEFPPVPVTLPWEDPATGELVTVPLVFVTTRGTVVKHNVFADVAWQPMTWSSAVGAVEVHVHPYLLIEVLAAGLLAFPHQLFRTPVLVEIGRRWSPFDGPGTARDSPERSVPAMGSWASSTWRCHQIARWSAPLR